MPRMRGRLYSSCASSTWSFPSALTACWAKMSRISCVRSTTRAVSAFSSAFCCVGSSSSSTISTSAFAASYSLLQLLELALADVRARIRARALLDELADRLDARRARELAQLAELLLGVGGLREHGQHEPALGLDARAGVLARRHFGDYATLVADDRPRRPARRAHARARRHPVREPQRGGDRVLRAAPLGEPTWRDGETLWYGERRGDRPLVVLAGHSTRCRRRTTSPAGLRDGVVHGLGASDMKGGVAVMLELARAWADLRRQPGARRRPALLPAGGAARGGQPAARTLRQRSAASTTPSSRSCSSRPTTRSRPAASAT